MSSSDAETSLLALRIAAAFGAVLAVALVVGGFRVGIWYGLGAVVLVPVLPMVFVLVTETARRNRD